ncbi:short-chain dehydrogenase [Kaistia sp. 32K]|uniref:SDR family NAD(P)-dependent oxidoreductase n=1 Tax=Kaistia sp. 32K TaxID=2795690 RepID=UPI001914FEF6|nr:SDR family oxidoreductase [Kaistia sp. 32K]BCP53665.1 short-chain dehydrogenase [Kaistia sp. 32K]
MTQSAGRFTGQTIIVTGAGAGIGRATALRLAAEGARVLAADISAANLESLAQQAPAGSIVAVAGDLTEQAFIDTLAAAGDGRIDGVANIAGITDGWLPPAEMDDATWYKVFELNLTAPMRLARAVLPQMLARGKGNFAFVSSEASFRSSLSGVAYTSSKHGLNGLAKSIAFYYGTKGIRSNVVAPGGVKTGMDTRFRSDYAKEITAPILETAPPSVEPDIIVHSILWLLSDDSPNINGVILPCDGGWTTM